MEAHQTSHALQGGGRFRHSAKRHTRFLAVLLVALAGTGADRCPAQDAPTPPPQTAAVDHTALDKELLEAAKEGSTDMVRSLLDRGADVNAKDDDGWTPLHWAAVLEQPEIARTLLDRGADIHARNNDGLTPLQVAEKEHKTQTAQLLRESEVAIDHPPQLTCRP